MKVSHFQEIIQVLLLKRKPWKIPERCSGNSTLWTVRMKRIGEIGQVIHLHGSLSFVCHWTRPSASVFSQHHYSVQSLSHSMSRQPAFPLQADVPSKSCSMVTASTQAWNLSPLCQQMLQTERRASVREERFKKRGKREVTCIKMWYLKFIKRKKNI